MLSNRFSNSNSGSSSSRNRNSNSNSNSMNRGSSSNNSSGKSNNNAGLASEGGTGTGTGTGADQGLGCDSARVASSTAGRYLLEFVYVLIFVWASLRTVALIRGKIVKETSINIWIGRWMDGG
jgi:hypothetical protein